MARLIAIVLALAAVAGVGYLAFRPDPPREVAFTRARRETIVSTVVTNGRVDPLEAKSVWSPRDGALARLRVEQGQQVQAGQTIAEFDTAAEQAEITAAESSIAQAKADLALFDRGPEPSAAAQLDSAAATASAELDAARRELATLERLEAKKAATGEQVTAARDRVARLDIELAGIRKRRAALAPLPAARTGAEARLRDAESRLALARKRIADSTVRAASAGVIYNLAVRPGAFLRTGDLIAEIGRTDRLRVNIYVDEPELGRVAVGMPVKVTWDATPGREWQGTVERMPARIEQLGSRQVGEVRAVLDNPEGLLRPGANVNIEIRSRVAENVLTIPKEGVRREGDQIGVWTLDGDAVAWRPVTLGVASVTRVEVTAGLDDGRPLALSTEAPLSPGEKVRAVFR